MPHYVYKIWSNKGNKVYYGSTSQKRNPKQRWHQHKAEYKGNYLNCSSKILFDEYGVENCIFEIIEECDNEEILRRRERWFIENNECVNKKLPVPTMEEIKESKQKYTLEHKEHKKEYDILYRANDNNRYVKIICECGGSYVRRHKAIHEKTKKHINAKK